MAKKILVTTDLSSNSKAGIRFAMQLAAQNGSALIFFQVIEQVKPTSWSKERYQKFADEEISRKQEELRRFVQSTYKQAGLTPGTIEVVVGMGTPVDKTIIEYAKTRKADLICMSTRGAGMIRRIVGTYTSALLMHSPIPVVAVPATYRRLPIRHVLYSTDLSDLKNELKQVKNFADPLQARLSVLHYDYAYDAEAANRVVAKAVPAGKDGAVKVLIKKPDLAMSLAEHLNADTRRMKPSVVVLFTRQNRAWFDRLFLPSQTTDLSFDTKVPLLVFRKRDT
jgi:nucleotide-binding universal stress UspA family protein